MIHLVRFQFSFILKFVVIGLLQLLLFSCNNDDGMVDEVPMPAVYEFLPENLIAIDSSRNITARYTDPTTRYDHGVFGDKIEAGGLFVTQNDHDFYLQLEEAFVFEDLQPRLADVDLDGELEFITIRSSVTEGASVAVYKIIDDQLQLMTSSPFIGTKYRWLNIAAISDLNQDGQIEIAWVQTPHIGGILRIFSLQNGNLQFLAEMSGASNHALNSQNLCLSILTSNQNQKTIYVPNNEFNAIQGFQLINKTLVEVDEIKMEVDAALPLFEQVELQGRVEDVSCIIVR